MNHEFRTRLLAGSAALVLAAFGGNALAADATAAQTPAADSAAADNADTRDITNADDIVVTGTAVNLSTPITASVHTFEPDRE